VLWSLVTGCGLGPERGAAPVLPPAEVWLEAADATLPGGVVGERYVAAVSVDGGVPPYTWRAADPLPSGLRLAPDGAITGVPVEAGTFTSALLVADAEGRQKRMLATIQVALVPRTVGCGGHLEGRFRDGIWRDGGGPDLARLDDLAWLAVELTHDATTRVDLVWSATGDLVTWVQRVNQVVGSWDLGGYAQRGVKAEDGTRTVPIDAGTDPSLTEYAQQTLLPVLVTPKEASAWTLDVVCTDGPVFQTLDKYPRRVGDAFFHDYEVFGDNAGVRIWTDDPLPAWMVWDEATGTVSGTAEEVGAWEFTLHARSADGRERAERALLGTFDVTDVACGDVVPVRVTEAWEEGDQVKRYDPRGFDVFRLPLGAPEVSAIEVRARGPGGHYLGLARPAPGWQVFFGHAEEQLVEEGAARLRIDPASYPASRHYVDAGEVYVTVGRTEPGGGRSRVAFTCDHTPRPDLRGLPILEVLAPVDLTLGGIGGTPPYRWEATGLPPGLRLAADGRVTGATGDVGRHAVTFTVIDARGARGRATWTWTVGATDACLGLPALGCGDAAAGELTAAGPDGGAAARDTWCVTDTSVDLGFTVYADDGEFLVALSDPAVDARSQLDDPARFTWAAELDRNQVVGVPFDTFSFPDRRDYVDRPLFVSVWAEDPGTYALELDCPIAP
jgi:hypothetical protein